ncbi:MAG: hypothetical protein SH820_04645 [Xanthomonadales bacterium]|nr:hypothetical protein [Xanthomonadales bacterium]
MVEDGHSSAVSPARSFYQTAHLPFIVIPDLIFLTVISDLIFLTVIPDLIRNPYPVECWIPGRARDDEARVWDDEARVWDDEARVWDDEARVRDNGLSGPG